MIKSKHMQRSPRVPVPIPLMPGAWNVQFISSYSFFRANCGAIGINALRAIELARAERDAEEHGLEIVWQEDNDMEIDWATDSASAVNRCEHEHDGRHIITSKEWRRRTNGHEDGSLDSRCPYSRDVALWGCVVVRRCGSACKGGETWLQYCKECEIVTSLWGIGSEPGSDYARMVEAELLSEAIGTLKGKDRAAMAVTRARGREYVGRGL